MWSSKITIKYIPNSPQSPKTPQHARGCSSFRTISYKTPISLEIVYLPSCPLCPYSVEFSVGAKKLGFYSPNMCSTLTLLPPCLCPLLCSQSLFKWRHSLSNLLPSHVVTSTPIPDTHLNKFSNTMK